MEVNLFLLYLALQADQILNLAHPFSILIVGAICLVSLAGYIGLSVIEKREKNKNLIEKTIPLLGKIFKNSLMVLCFFLLLKAFFPNTKTLLIIAGIDQIVEIYNGSEQIQQIPDKLMQLINKELDDALAN